MLRFWRRPDTRFCQAERQPRAGPKRVTLSDTDFFKDTNLYRRRAAIAGSSLARIFSTSNADGKELTLVETTRSRSVAESQEMVRGSD